jgi:hypothetical protein
VVLHHILLNRGDKTIIEGVVGFIEKRTILIHRKPLLPTLIPTNHVPIVIFMCMMQIIVSHFIQSCNKVNHKSQMPIKAKKGGVHPTKT